MIHEQIEMKEIEISDHITDIDAKSCKLKQIIYKQIIQCNNYKYIYKF